MFWKALFFFIYKFHVFDILKKKAFENIMGKGENDIFSFSLSLFRGLSWDLYKMHPFGDKSMISLCAY